MTFLELQQLVSYWVDDLNMTYFTPTQIKRFLNNAQRECQKLLVGAGQEWHTICKKTDLVVNQREYVLPDDFLRLNRLELVISGTVPNQDIMPLQRITPNQRDMIAQGSATPQFYWLRKNRLVLKPWPDQILTMRLFYTYRVADMVSDSEVPDIAEQYHEFIAILAAIDCLLKDGRDPSTLFNKRDYYLQMMKDDAAQREVDESRTVIETGEFSDDYAEYFW